MPAGQNQNSPISLQIKEGSVAITGELSTLPPLFLFKLLDCATQALPVLPNEFCTFFGVKT